MSYHKSESVFDDEGGELAGSVGRLGHQIGELHAR